MHPWVDDIKLTWKTLPSIIWYFLESGVQQNLLYGIQYPVEFDIRVLSGIR